MRDTFLCDNPLLPKRLCSLLRVLAWRNYHIRVYLSFLQHESCELVHSMEISSFSWFDTGISFKAHKFVYSKLFHMSHPQTMKGSFLWWMDARCTHMQQSPLDHQFLGWTTPSNIHTAHISGTWVYYNYFQKVTPLLMFNKSRVNLCQLATIVWFQYHKNDITLAKPQLEINFQPSHMQSSWVVI